MSSNGRNYEDLLAFANTYFGLMVHAVEEGEPFDAEQAAEALAGMADDFEALGYDVSLSPKFVRMLAETLRGRTPNARKVRRRPFDGPDNELSWLNKYTALRVYDALCDAGWKREAAKQKIAADRGISVKTIEKWLSLPNRPFVRPTKKP